MSMGRSDNTSPKNRLVGYAGQRYIVTEQQNRLSSSPLRQNLMTLRSRSNVIPIEVKNRESRRCTRRQRIDDDLRGITELARLSPYGTQESIPRQPSYGVSPQRRCCPLDSTPSLSSSSQVSSFTSSSPSSSPRHDSSDNDDINPQELVRHSDMPPSSTSPCSSQRQLSSSSSSFFQRRQECIRQCQRNNVSSSLSKETTRQGDRGANIMPVVVHGRKTSPLMQPSSPSPPPPPSRIVYRYTSQSSTGSWRKQLVKKNSEGKHDRFRKLSATDNPSTHEKERMAGDHHIVHTPPPSIGILSQQYTYQELVEATDFFDPRNKLGRGACGAVYAGTLASGTEIAVKVLKACEANGFEEEIRVLSRCRHPNLVTLFGWGEHDTRRFIVYEFLPGGDLCKRIENSILGKTPFHWKERLRIAVETCQGVSYLHGCRPKVFHRDIKAANVLLNEHGTAKLADFGLACVAGVALESSCVERPEGTPGYADPTYVRTLEINEAREVYSLGMLLLELLTGKPPAVYVHNGRGKDVLKYLLDDITWGSVESLFPLIDQSARVPKLVAERWIQLCFRCIAQDETTRPQSAEVVRELRKLLKLSVSPATADGDMLNSKFNAKRNSISPQTPSYKFHRLTLDPVATPATQCTDHPPPFSTGGPLRSAAASSSSYMPRQIRQLGERTNFAFERHQDSAAAENANNHSSKGARGLQRAKPVCLRLTEAANALSSSQEHLRSNRHRLTITAPQSCDAKRTMAVSVTDPSLSEQVYVFHVVNSGTFGTLPSGSPKNILPGCSLSELNEALQSQIPEFAVHVSHRIARRMFEKKTNDFIGDSAIFGRKRAAFRGGLRACLNSELFSCVSRQHFSIAPRLRIASPGASSVYDSFEVQFDFTCLSPNGAGVNRRSLPVGAVVPLKSGDIIHMFTPTSNFSSSASQSNAPQASAASESIVLLQFVVNDRQVARFKQRIVSQCLRKVQVAIQAVARNRSSQNSKASA